MRTIYSIASGMKARETDASRLRLVVMRVLLDAQAAGCRQHASLALAALKSAAIKGEGGGGGGKT